MNRIIIYAVAFLELRGKRHGQFICVRVTVFSPRGSDSELIWLGGPDTYIVNETTGVRYKARRALPPGDLNRYILVKGCKGQEFMYTIVFPDLPTGWWHGCFYGIPYCQLRGGVPIANVSQYFEN